MSLTSQQKDKLSKARYKLYKKQPFLWQLIHYLKVRPTKAIPTMGVDIHGNLYTNMEFFDGMDVEDLVWVLAHEIMHLVTTTHKRYPAGAHKALWNIASDIAINKIITDKAHIPIIKNIKPYYGPEFSKYDDWTTEKIYYDLLDNGCSAVKVVKCSSNGFSGDEDNPHDGNGYWHDDSGTEVSKGAAKDGEAIEQWRQRVAAAKQAGKVSGELEPYLMDLLQPQHDWKKELRQFVQTTLRRKSTWMRPGRRTVGAGIRTPSKDREMPSVVAYCDTSGSMSDEILRSCLSEISAICSLSGGKVRLILGDCEIYSDCLIENSDFSNLKLKRGGTDFTVLFDHIAKSEEPEPKLLVGFTDAYGPFPEKHPNYPVLWVLLKGQSATPPWGKVLEINGD